MRVKSYWWSWKTLASPIISARACVVRNVKGEKDPECWWKRMEIPKTSSGSLNFKQKTWNVSHHDGSDLFTAQKRIFLIIWQRRSFQISGKHSHMSCRADFFSDCHIISNSRATRGVWIHAKFFTFHADRTPSGESTSTQNEEATWRHGENESSFNRQQKEAREVRAIAFCVFFTSLLSCAPSVSGAKKENSHSENTASYDVDKVQALIENGARFMLTFWAATMASLERDFLSEISRLRVVRKFKIWLPNFQHLLLAQRVSFNLKLLLESSKRWMERKWLLSFLLKLHTSVTSKSTWMFISNWEDNESNE